MEGKNPKVKQQKAKGSSVLQVEGNYFNKIMSREASVGQSSRRSYNRPPEGVPFKWEMRPGTPKINPGRAEEEEIITPPLSPSPLMQSQGLPKPSNWLIEPPPPPVGCMLPSEWLRNKFKKIKRSTSNIVQTSGMRKSSPRIGDSNREISSSNTSSSSSSSFPSLFSLSSFNGRGVEKDQEDSSAQCIPGWNKNKILVRVARQN